MPLWAPVPMIPVWHIERSLEFYRLLGFAVGNRVPQQDASTGHDCTHRTLPSSVVVQTLGSAVVNVRSTAPQGASCYLYATDLVSLLAKLVSAAKNPGGRSNILSIFPRLSLQTRIRWLAPHACPERLRHTLMLP